MENKTRILIVDDHQLVIQGILCSLKEVGDFDVVTANTCDDADSSNISDNDGSICKTICSDSAKCYHPSKYICHSKNKGLKRNIFNKDTF